LVLTVSSRLKQVHDDVFRPSLNNSFSGHWHLCVTLYTRLYWWHIFIFREDRKYFGPQWG